MIRTAGSVTPSHSRWMRQSSQRPSNGAVLLDRLEPDVLVNLGSDPDDQRNAVDRVAQELAQAAIAAQVGGIFKAQNAVFRRAKSLSRLEPALEGGGLSPGWTPPFLLSSDLIACLSHTQPETRRPPPTRRSNPGHGRQPGLPPRPQCSRA